MVFRGDILKDIPEPYLSDFLSLGLIEAYDATGVNEIPEYVSTGTGIKVITEEKPKEVKRTGGKPNRKTQKK